VGDPFEVKFGICLAEFPMITLIFFLCIVVDI